jgi:hypothetical protein
MISDRSIDIFVSTQIERRLHMLCSLSNLKEQDVERIKSLETDLGQTLLAFSCHDVSPAILDGEKLEKLQSAEKDLGISLVAVNA